MHIHLLCICEDLFWKIHVTLTVNIKTQLYNMVISDGKHVKQHWMQHKLGKTSTTWHLLIPPHFPSWDERNSDSTRFLAYSQALPLSFFWPAHQSNLQDSNIKHSEKKKRDLNILINWDPLVHFYSAFLPVGSRPKLGWARLALSCFKTPLSWN